MLAVSRWNERCPTGGSMYIRSQSSNPFCCNHPQNPKRNLSCAYFISFFRSETRCRRLWQPPLVVKSGNLCKLRPSPTNKARKHAGRAFPTDATFKPVVHTRIFHLELRKIEKYSSRFCSARSVHFSPLNPKGRGSNVDDKMMLQF